VTLFGDMLRGGEPRARLWRRAVIDLFVVLFQHKEETVSYSARVSLAMISAAPILLGAGLGSVLIDEWGDLPVRLWLIVAAVLIQGSFTLLWLSGGLDRWERWATALLAAGETLALLAGTLLATIGPGAVDEIGTWYGPVSIGVVVAVHGLIGLLVLFTRPHASAPGTS
jgi:hypothetical protein